MIARAARASIPRRSSRTSASDDDEPHWPAINREATAAIGISAAGRLWTWEDDE